MSNLEIRYPKLYRSVLAVEPFVAMLRQNPTAELEARFGIIEHERFRPGVSRAMIERIIDMMQASPHIGGDDEWREEQDFFFEQNGVPLRTRVMYDHSALTVTPTTIRKEAMGNVDLRGGGNTDNVDIRISLKDEKEVQHTDACVRTHMVRIKQRRRFVTENGAWAFDFALSWSGKTKTDAEKAQASEDPQFEVECELIDAERVLALQSDRRIALSLLLKMTDLLQDEEVEILPAF